MKYKQYQKMKDSGVEWIGEIPEHWEVKKLKHLVKQTKDGIKPGPFGSDLKVDDLTDDGYRVYNQRSVIEKDLKNGDEFISEKKFNSLKTFSVEPNDILLSSRGTIGECVIVPENSDPGVIHPCIIRLRFDDKKILLEFAELFIQNSSVFKHNVNYNSNATVINVIYSDTLKEIKIPMPPPLEQKSIIGFTKTETTRLDNLISKSQLQIKLLQEKRQALITSAVTGKIDVRNGVAA